MMNVSLLLLLTVLLVFASIAVGGLLITGLWLLSRRQEKAPGHSG